MEAVLTTTIFFINLRERQTLKKSKSYFIDFYFKEVVGSNW